MSETTLDLGLVADLRDAINDPAISPGARRLACEMLSGLASASGLQTWELLTPGFVPREGERAPSAGLRA